jgi:hypothetical protein
MPMKVLLAPCIIGLSIGAAWAKDRREPHPCFDRCTQEMKACYRINDVIYIDHCDREYRRCSAACAPKNHDDAAAQASISCATERGSWPTKASGRSKDFASPLSM